MAEFSTSLSIEGSEAQEVTPETPKVEAAPKAPVATSLPEGFESVEDLAAAYAELKGKPATEEPLGALKIVPSTDATAQAKAAGIDVNAIAQEVVANGALSAETLAALEAKGISKETAASIVEGQKAQAQLIVGRLAEAVGGPEALKQMLAWGAVNLSSEEAQTINSMLQTSEPAAKVALKGLQAQFEAVNGKLPAARVNGDAVTLQSGEKPFGSQDEMIRAMQDPRYNAGDIGYIERVGRRIAASSGLVTVSSNRLFS